MALDEAIEQFKYDAECNRADLDLSYAEDNEQVAEWLEELKELRKYFNSTEIGKYRFQKGYNNAIDEFINECDKYCGFYSGKNKNIIREDILKIAEQLKAGGENENYNKEES